MLLAHDVWKALWFTDEATGKTSFGVGVGTSEPGSLKGLQMVVADVKEVRDELVKRGI